MNKSTLKHFLKLSLFAIFLLGTISTTFSQTIVSGVVFDETNQPLPSATIRLEGTTVGTITNVKGEYRLPVQPGSHTVVISFIGFESQKEEITIEKGQTIKLDFTLKPEYILGEEVVVTAQARGQLGAINKQLNANSVMNAVSKDRLQELPDANIAESLGRVPGLSVTRNAGEASQIVIRGLEPKLNAIAINGVKVPSTSSGSRAVDLSMISSELLEAVEVYKAPTPDMDAEAIGGIVNLKIKKAPKESSAYLKIDGGYNQLNNDFSNFKGVGQYSRRFFDSKLGVIVGGNMEKINRASESLNSSYRIDGVRDSITGLVPIRGTSADVRKTEEIRKRYGASLTIDYAYDKGVVWFSSFFTQTSREIFSVNKGYSDGDMNVVYDVRDREVDLRGLSTSLNGEHQLGRMDIDWVVSRYTTQTDNKYDWQMEFREDGGRVYDSTFVAGKPETYPGAARNDLDYMYLRNAYMRPDTTTQTNYTGELNFELPFTLNDKITGFLKFGGKYSQSDRDRSSLTRGQAFYYLGGDRISEAQDLYPEPLIINDYQSRLSARNFVVPNSEPINIVNNEYEMYPIYDKVPIRKWYDTQQPNLHFDRNALADKYNLSESIRAGYLMAKVNLGKALTIIPGARYEYSDNEYHGVWSTVNGSYGSDGTARDTMTTKKYGHWFPHLHMKLKPVSWYDLRFSVNKTLARPDYSWISPWTQISPFTKRISRGNPELTESKSWNYELSSSFYSNKFGLLTIGGFYKDISDIFYSKSSRVVDNEEIEYLQIPGGAKGYLMRSYANSDEANVKGIEIDLQTQLKMFKALPRFMQGFVVNVNYSRIWSETSFPFNTYKQVFDYTTWPATVSIEYEETERKGNMPGQSEHIFNGSLGYDIGGFSARASVLYQGKSISSVGTIVEADRWNNDYWRFDAALKYKLNRMISFHANLANITSQPDRTYYGSEKYQTSRYYYGMTANLGVEFRF